MTTRNNNHGRAGFSTSILERQRHARAASQHLAVLNREVHLSGGALIWLCFVQLGPRVGALTRSVRPAQTSTRRRFHSLGFDASGLGDLYETLLNKLCGPRHGIGVDLNSGNSVRIPPTVGLCCSATEFDLDTVLHQVCDQFSIGIPSSNIAVVVVRLVVQRRVAGVCVKDYYNLGLGLPIGDIVHDELKVKERRRQIAFERKRCDAKDNLELCQFNWDINVKRFFLNSHMNSFGEMEFTSRNQVKRPEKHLR